MRDFIVKGDFIWCCDKDNLVTKENSYAVCINGKCKGVFDSIPSAFKSLEIVDYSGCLIIPGMTDLHIHAPQFEFRGNGMDLELMQWLDTYTFPAETRYNDVSYAEKAYSLFTDEIRKSATTRLCMFATGSLEGTKVLMDLMEKTGLVSYVGRVLADRLVPPALLSDINKIESEVEKELDYSKSLKYTKPILTPRFYPACSDSLLSKVAQLQKKYSMPLQSHLSENPQEIETVKNLCPDSKFYGDAYDRTGTFGTNGKTIMAHCVYSGDEEIALMKKNNVFIAHSPASNLNLASGIAPVSKYLSEGLNVGLATDVAGGHSTSMMRAVTDAIQVSKMYWRYINSSYKPLTFCNALYIATIGGGSFFGKVGSFDEDFDFDAVVIKDDDIPYVSKPCIEKRAERAFYLEMDRTSVKAKFCQGREIN